MLYSLLYYDKNNCTESGKDVEWSGIWENRESENVINLFCTLYEYYFYLVFSGSGIGRKIFKMQTVLS